MSMSNETLESGHSSSHDSKVTQFLWHCNHCDRSHHHRLLYINTLYHYTFAAAALPLLRNFAILQKIILFVFSSVLFCIKLNECNFAALDLRKGENVQLNFVVFTFSSFAFDMFVGMLYNEIELYHIALHHNLSSNKCVWARKKNPHEFQLRIMADMNIVGVKHGLI